MSMILTENDIKFGFWGSQYDAPVIAHFDDLKIDAYKSIIVGFYDELKRAKEVKKWNRKLIDLSNIEYLRTYHKVNQETFDIITQMKNLKGLSIKWSSVRSIESIGNLKKLENLNLGLSTNIESISPLKDLTQLKTFTSENLKKVADWDILKNSTALQALGINGGLSEFLKMESIEFLRKLENLIHLSLIKVHVKDNSLKPIEQLKSLQCLWLSDKWSRDQMDELRTHLPRLQYGNVFKEDEAQRLLRLLKDRKG